MTTSRGQAAAANGDNVIKAVGGAYNDTSRQKRRFLVVEALYHQFKRFFPRY